MPSLAIMIEGQNGLTWERWRRIATTVESAGFDGLYRSDHFTNPSGPVRDALELWVSLTWLAYNTDRIEFGSLVTPVSFRDPVFTARMAKDVDNLSEGRFTLGLGAGWQEREHDAFGYDLLDVPARFDRFEEGLTVIRDLLRSEDPVSFDGEYYSLEEAVLLPRSQREIPLLVGGNGPRRTLPLAARFADEWNGVYLPPSEFEDRSERLDDLLEREGREPAAVTRSLMTRVIFGRDETELQQLLEDSELDDDPAALRDRGLIVGTADTVAGQLAALDDAGVDRVMLQWLELDDVGRLAALADAVA